VPIAEVYRDVAQPAAREVGEALENAAKVARFALAPVDYLAAQHLRWKRYLERVAEKVPEDRRVEAHPQLAGPVFAGLQYVEETSIKGSGTYMKKAAPVRESPFLNTSAEAPSQAILDSLNVLCLKAFWALSHVEADAWAFGQGFEA